MAAEAAAAADREAEEQRRLLESEFEAEKAAMLAEMARLDAQLKAEAA